jgi:tetratricopeptide (TPR) repeat protein
LADFNRAIELNPEGVNAYNNRGLVQLRSGSADKAVADFSEAIARNPMNPRYYLHRRTAYQKLGDAQAASADATQIRQLQTLAVLNVRLARSPQDVELLLARGDVFHEMRQWERAIANYDRVLQIDPQNATAHAKRGAVAFAREDYQQAVAECTAAIGIEPIHKALSIRGDAYLKQGDYDRAIADYEAAKRFDSTVAVAYLKRSQHHRKQGDEQKAAADFQQAVALDPSLEKSRQ